MSFLYGIIDFEHPIPEDDFHRLEQAIIGPDFSVHHHTHPQARIGYCTYPGRPAKAGIYTDDNLILLMDVRLYGHPGPAADTFAQAYRTYGPDCARRLNGDYAAVAIHTDTREVVLLRDHIGARPLVYALEGSRLIFASHQFAMARSGLVPADLNEDNIIRKMFHIAGGHEQTVFKRIRRVLSGQYLRVQQQRVQATTYWNPSTIKTTPMTFQEAVQGLREQIVRATVSRMEGGRTGLHVSGGIDSAGVASIVADHTPDKNTLIGYSWTPETPPESYEGIDERPYIEAIQREKGIPVQYLKATAQDMLRAAAMPEFEHQHIELPVMQQAERDGVRQLFSGWGGDELVSMSLRGLYNHFFFRGEWATLLRYMRKSNPRGAMSRFVREVLRYLFPLFNTGYHPLDVRLLRYLTAGGIRRHAGLLAFHKRNNIMGYGSRKAFCTRLIDNFHMQYRIESWAINGEYHGLEYQYPLLDRRMLEYFFSIPVEHTFHHFQPRLLYREAMRGIMPDMLCDRKEKAEALRIGFMFSYFKQAPTFFMGLLHGSEHGGLNQLISKEAMERLLRRLEKDPSTVIKHWGLLTLYIKCRRC